MDLWASNQTLNMSFFAPFWICLGKSKKIRATVLINPLSELQNGLTSRIMNKRICLVIFSTLSIVICSAQSEKSQQSPQSQQPAQSAKFRSDTYVGISSGQWGNYGLVQTVNGYYKGPWFLGLGAGLDNYRFRSFPLFLALTRDLPAFSKGSGLFVDLDAGINLPWYTRPLPLYDGFTSSKFHAGLWWSAGLGYKWMLSARNRKALLISVAYSEKKLKEVEIGPIHPCYTSSCAMILNTGQQTYSYEYLYRVFLLKIGFQF
jgi:hypothetical protein